MNIKTKRFFLAHIVILIIVIVLGQLGRARMPKCGIEKVRTMEQLYELEVAATSIFEDEYYDGFAEYKDDYINELEDAAIVAVVRPTGNIHPYHLTFCHEVIVEEVIQGNDNLENKILQIYDESAKFMTNENHNSRLEYRDIKNLMQSGHTYLAFFFPLELNHYFKEDVYRFHDSFFNYLDLGNGNTKSILKSSEKADFRKIKEIEFFTSSQRVLDILIEIKQKIIEKYI